jgi:hypothetical protein
MDMLVSQGHILLNEVMTKGPAEIQSDAEVYKTNEQLTQLDLTVVQDLLFELRLARTANNPVPFAKLERGLIALAAIHGATRIADVEGAIEDLLSDAVSADKLTEEVSDLTQELVAVEAQRDALQAILDTMKDMVEDGRYVSEGIVVLSHERRGRAIGIFLAANEALRDQPAHSRLAAKALEAANTLQELEMIPMKDLEA